MRVEWVEYDEDTEKVYGDGRLLPATYTRPAPSGTCVDIDFRLENGLTASMTIFADQDTEPDDRVLMSLCLWEPGDDRTADYHPTILHDDKAPLMGFDPRTVPADEAWIVEDDDHGYGIINESLASPRSAEQLFDTLRAWSRLKPVDKRKQLDNRTKPGYNIHWELHPRRVPKEGTNHDTAIPPVAWHRPGRVRQVAEQQGSADDPAGADQ